MLTVLTVIVCVLVGLILLVVMIGYALPRDHVAARAAVLGKPPAGVWAALVDLDAIPEWRSGVKSIERLSPTTFREHGAQGSLTYEIVEERKPELLITRVADDKLPFGGRWIYELAPAGDGTRLTITEDGFVKNPIFRFLSRTVYPTTSTIEKFVAELAKHLATSVIIEPAEPSQRVRR